MNDKQLQEIHPVEPDTPAARLMAMANVARQQYLAEIAAGGEPVYPAWIEDVVAVCRSASATIADAPLASMARAIFGDRIGGLMDAMAAAPPCPTCNDQGAVGNILTAEPCPDCTPPASAQDDAKDERSDSIALDKLADYIADNWPDKKYGLEEICQRLHATWPGAFMPAAPAAGDAQMASQLLPKLQSLLDRMANDPHTGALFEADGDTLRDAMHLCRSVNVYAAIAQQSVRKGE